MRESRQTSVLSNSQKLKYPKCEKKKEHAKESLNFVCLSSQCKFKGLICVMCKGSTEHTGHNIQPLRTFLSKLQDSLKKLQLSRAPKMEQNPSNVFSSQHSLLQKLEQNHLQMLSLLKIQIDEVSQRVRICEQQVIKEFNRIKQKIYTQFQKQTIINKTLAEVQKFFAEVERQEPIDLKFNIAKLLALLKVEKNDYSILNEAEKELNVYTFSAKTFKNNLLVWERETSNILAEIFKNKPEYQIKEGLVRPTTAIDSSSKSAALTFSTQLKTESILLDKELKIAKVKDDKHGKIAVLNQSVLEHKNVPIRFKISGQMGSSIIQLGLCMKTHITQKQFKFQKTNNSHGLHVASSNGYVFSSNDPQANNSKGHLTFKSGDQLSVEVDIKDSKLIVKKKSDSKSVEISLKHLSQSDWKQLHFCINLSSVGDKVQLLG